MNQNSEAIIICTQIIDTLFGIEKIRKDLEEKHCVCILAKNFSFLTHANFDI